MGVRWWRPLHGTLSFKAGAEQTVSFQFLVAIYQFVILIFSLCVHESAHAWMASRLGDQTARLQGRITLNPAYHVDPIGTLLFPALMIFGPLIGVGGIGNFLIGWAKPVPVNTRNFRKIVRDDNLTTMAGPASNLLIALVSFLGLLAIIHIAPNGRELVVDAFVEGKVNMSELPLMTTAILLLMLAIFINLSLCLFNLMPVPPLDGSHVFRNMLPYNAVQVYDRIPYLISLAILLLVGRPIVGFLMTLVMTPIDWGIQHL
jgi:Zn-dependent protease